MQLVQHRGIVPLENSVEPSSSLGVSLSGCGLAPKTDAPIRRGNHLREAAYALPTIYVWRGDRSYSVIPGVSSFS